MWTAAITNVTKTGSGLAAEVVVAFTDGTTINTIPFMVHNVADVKQLVVRQVAQYKAIDTFCATPPLGEVDLTPPVPPDPPVPTQEERDKALYVADYAKSLQMQAAIKEGILQADDADYVALKASLVTRFKPEYLSVFNGGFRT